MTIDQQQTDSSHDLHAREKRLFLSSFLSFFLSYTYKKVSQLVWMC
jgi:hypothetical protein